MVQQRKALGLVFIVCVVLRVKKTHGFVSSLLHSPEKCNSKQAQSFLSTATWKMQSSVRESATTVRQESI